MDEVQLSKIDNWVGEQAENLTRPEAIRRLIGIGLSVKSKVAVHFSDGEKMLILMMGDLYKKLQITHGEMEPRFLAQKRPLAPLTPACLKFHPICLTSL